MNKSLLLLALATACASSEKDSTVDTSDTDTGTDTDSPVDTGDTTDPVDTAPPEDTSEPIDTAPPPVIATEGSWNLSSPTIAADSCGVNSYQDVTEFVPSELMISESTEASFRLDAETVCTRNDLAFTCSAQDVSESALAGTAELQINSVMSGLIVDENTLDITMDVTIEDCDGIGCIAIEAVLKFPCPVELSTGASKS